MRGGSILYSDACFVSNRGWSWFGHHINFYDPHLLFRQKTFICTGICECWLWHRKLYCSFYSYTHLWRVRFQWYLADHSRCGVKLLCCSIDFPEIVGNNQESEQNNEDSANANGKMESNSGGTALGKEAIAYSPKFNRSLAFYFFLASLAFLSSCTSCVQVLILGLAEEHGIASSEHTMIFSAMAIVETVSLIPIGFMLDLPRVKPFRQYVYCCILMLYGLCIGLMAFFKENYKVMYLCVSVEWVHLLCMKCSEEFADSNFTDHLWSINFNKFRLKVSFEYAY